MSGSTMLLLSQELTHHKEEIPVENPQDDCNDRICTFYLLPTSTHASNMAEWDLFRT